ncbi:AAA family ATPase [Parvularcula sp. IMCC14364]|uniref:AAA family ATPase n=1 Tax=Parvularcula sp. IMCC14364 TaxID=3067902 RepID=UPI0027407E61|nr:AAA family ATPase [Parvularcula sp. IMCC14364]
MSNLANNKFDFDTDDAFTEEELADLEALSEEDIDIDFDDDDFDLDDMDCNIEGWDDAEVAAPPPMPDVPPQIAETTNTNDDFSDSEEEALAAIEQALDMVNEPKSKIVDDFADEDFDDDFGDEDFPADLPPLTASVTQDFSAKTADASPVPPATAVTELESYEEDDVPQDGDHIPVPRINIGVFCETQGTSELVEAAASDRRLSKAHINIFMGGLKKAVQHFQSETTPNLLIIETVSPNSELFEGLEQLAEVCDPSTKVIVVGHVNDVRLYRELMDRGISEYLISPKRPIQITRSIASLYVDPSAPPIGRSIVFVGARGGVGSSTVCHNVAWAIAELHKSDTVILDLDLAFGTASLDFEQDPSQGLAEALAAPERLDDVLLDRLLQKCTDRLSLFAAPNMLDRDYDMPASSFEEVLDMVRRGVPNLVIDLPHAWTEWTRSILHSADEIVITATPDLSSFRNAKNLIESVKASRTNDAPPYLVLNQMGVPKRPEIPVEQFAEALEIDPIAVINWDPQLFGMAATNAEPVFETNGKSKAATSLDQVASTILGQSNEKNSGRGFDIKSLFRKL